MRRRRAPWIAMAATLALMLYPLQALASPADSVKSYTGLTGAQRADLRAIARDTWNFYSADVDPNTHLPLDNITYAGGSATPTSYGRYTSASNVGVYLWAVVSASDLGLISKSEASDRVAATLHTVANLQRDNGFLYQWYDTSTGHVIKNPGVRQLLLHLQRRQRVVRFRPDRRAAGTACHRATGEQPRRADELRKVLRRPRRDALQRQPGHSRQPADRADVRRLLRRPAARSGRQLDALLPQRRLLQRPADLGVHRHGHAPDARQRLVAQLARAAAARPVRRLPDH